MTQENQHPHQYGHKMKRGWHRDWRMWIVVGLMLAAMVAYVLSDDESLQPSGGPSQQPVPAAVGP
jgi:hypothetical protein